MSLLVWCTQETEESEHTGYIIAKRMTFLTACDRILTGKKKKKTLDPNYIKTKHLCMENSLKSVKQK